MGGGGWMWGMSLWAVLIVVPFWKILPRHGIAKWFSLLAILPVGALILLWIVAFRDQFADRQD